MKTIDFKTFNQLKTLSDSNAFFKESDFKAQPVLLLFYNNQCLGCTGRAIPFAFQLQQEFSCRVVLIHSDFGQPSTAKTIASIFTTKAIPFEIYRDEYHKLYDYFSCEGTPHWVLINQQAEVVQSIFGSQANAQNRLLYSLEEVCKE